MSSPAPGDGPWRITFDTNPDDCNLRCVMCEEHSPFSHLQAERRRAGRPPRRMEPELIRKVVADAKPHGLREIIPSTMGEPLLYEGFEDILEVCREHDVKLNLTTNGTFPKRGADAWARLLVPVTSDVKISWNGARPKTAEAVMLGVRFGAVLENVRAFIAVRDAHTASGGNHCRVTFQMTFLESNIQELPDIVRLAASLGVERVKGHHLWVHFKEIGPLSMRRDPAAIGRWNQAVEAARAAQERFRLASGAKVLLENVFPLDPLQAAADIAPDAACPFLGQEAWVAADGRFNVCCAPDAQRRTLGEYGNVREQSVMAIWRSAAYAELRDTYLDRPLCRGCNMRRPAGTGG